MNSRKVITSDCKKKGNYFLVLHQNVLIEISNGRAYSACVAGSIKRGKSAAEDRKLGDELLEDRKNREEHQYVVNMISQVFENFLYRYQNFKSTKIDENS